MSYVVVDQVPDLNFQISNLNFSYGEFDPGSELTLVACLSHASRTRKPSSEGEYSGERVSNAWVIYLLVGDNTPNGVLIPNTKAELRLSSSKAASACKLSPGDEPASY